MARGQWQRRAYGAGGLTALAALFLSVVMLSQNLIHGARLDLTEGHLYTLSPGTAAVLAQLHDPVTLTFYFSRTAAAKDSPLILPYATRVGELLAEIAARSAGKVRLRTIDPQPFSEDEDRAAALGLTALPGGGGDTLFFGLAGSNAADGHGVIASFSPERERFLEYDLAKLIQELGTTRRPVVAIQSTLPIQGQLDPMTGQPGEPWPILAQLDELFTVRYLEPNAAQIGDDVAVLVLIHPQNLPPATLYAIDQYVLRGGHLLALVDPNSGADPGASEAGSASNLAPLFQAWGVDYDPGLVIGDAERGLEVRTSPQAPPEQHIAILGLRKTDLNGSDVATASLDSLNLATSGTLAPRPGAKTTFSPLASSSTQAAPIPVARFVGLSDPAVLRQGFQPTGKRYVLAARITGEVESAYPAGPPAGYRAPPGPPRPHLARSVSPVNLVIIADTDLLLDYMWVQTREMFGQRVMQPFAGNGDLIANLVDNLSGSAALISIRSRAGFSRPFERVEALRHRADERLRGKALELTTQLRQTEARLNELQGRSADQEAELRRFTAEKLMIRKELRETQHGLDVDIDRLYSWLRVLNLTAAPLLVAIAGSLWLRRRRRRAAAP